MLIKTVQWNHVWKPWLSTGPDKVRDFSALFVILVPICLSVSFSFARWRHSENEGDGPVCVPLACESQQAGKKVHTNSVIVQPCSCSQNRPTLAHSESVWKVSHRAALCLRGLSCAKWTKHSWLSVAAEAGELKRKSQNEFITCHAPPLSCSLNSSFLFLLFLHLLLCN